MGPLRSEARPRAAGVSRPVGARQRPPPQTTSPPALPPGARRYHRIQDCWGRPIAGPPFAGRLDVINRAPEKGGYSLQCGEGREGEGEGKAGGVHTIF